MLVSAFETRVNVNIVEGLVKLGRYEQEGLSLALGTKSWNVVIISPHSAIQESKSGAVKKRLAINRDITAIETAHFGSDDSVDVVLIGTTTNLLAYNVETNCDLFYKDVPDGVNAILFVDDWPIDGVSRNKKVPMVMVGGNCSIQAFDEEGEEVFWTVTSDAVRCLVLVDIDKDGVRELLVGSEDGTIKALKGEQVVFGLAESAAVHHLQPLDGAADTSADCFAYGLSNGTIGVYAGAQKLWMAQNKERVTSMHCYSNCLIVGFSNGLVEARKVETGKVLWSSLVVDGNRNDESVAGIVVGNLRGHQNQSSHSKQQLITVSTKGLLSAWIPMTPSTNSNKATHSNQQKLKSDTLSVSATAEASTARRSVIGAINNMMSEYSLSRPSVDAEELATRDDLQCLEAARAEREGLLEELGYLSANWKTLKSNELDDPSLIPPNTEIACTLSPSIEQKRLLLVMHTNNSTVIKAAVIYGDKVFQNGSFMLMPSTQSSTLSMPLRFEKDLQCTLSIKAIVGHLSSAQNHVFELSHRIPKFASYLYVPSSSIPSAHAPTASVSLQFPRGERMNRLILWLNQAFLLEYEANSKRSIDISFVSLRNGEYMTLQFQEGTLRLLADNLTLAGDIVQDICQYLSVKELTSEFRNENVFCDLRANLEGVAEFNAIRSRLSIDIAANTATIKNLIVKAEDARKLKRYADVKRFFSELFDVNQEMVGELAKRTNNHKQLIKALKAINKSIEQVSRLRCGKFQKLTVSMARTAVKAKNVDALIAALTNVSTN